MDGKDQTVATQKDSPARVAFWARTKETTLAETRTPTA